MVKSTKNIVLVHGWGASVSKLQLLADALNKSGWNVFLPKLPGFDLPAPLTAWDMDAYADYVYKKSVKYFKNRPFILFGHSFGGRVVIKLAQRKLVKGIILCATGGLSWPHIIKRKAFEVVSKVGKLVVESIPHSHKFKKLMYKAAREHDYEQLKGTMRATFRNVVEEDLKPQVYKISKKTLIIWGDIDKMTPVVDAHFLHQSIKDSTLRIFKGQGHTLPYRVPTKIVRTIETWD